MNSISRSTALKIAAVLAFLIGAFNVVVSLPAVTQGAAVINASPDSPPYIVMLIGLLAGVAGMIAAYGTWKQQRWGIVLTIILTAINGLSAAPGILFAPETFLFIAAIFTVIISILIIVLCLWRDPKPALA
jgi:hypothetical protein